MHIQEMKRLPNPMPLTDFELDQFANMATQLSANGGADAGGAITRLIREVLRLKHALAIAEARSRWGNAAV